MSKKKVITMKTVNGLIKLDSYYSKSDVDEATVRQTITKIVKPVTDYIASCIRSGYYDKLFEMKHCDFELVVMYILASGLMKDEMLARLKADPVGGIDILSICSDAMELIMKDLCTEAAYKKLQDLLMSEIKKEIEEG